MSLVLEKCSAEELCAVFGESEKLLNELLEKLEDWLKLQPHLPQDPSKERLKWFLMSNKLSLERAKRKLDMYYTMRRFVPEFFESRDPRARTLTTLKKRFQMVVLPKLGPEKCRIIIARNTITDYGKTQFQETLKYMLMVSEVRITEDCAIGEKFIFDLSMTRLNHVAHFSPTILKKFQTVCLNAYGLWIKGVYIINAPPFADRIMAMIKPLLHPKIVNRIHIFRADNLDGIYKFLPKSILPKDYGGDEPSMDELAGSLNDKIDEWRDWYLENEKIMTNESLRPGAALDRDNLFGYSGSFRKLDID